MGFKYIKHIAEDGQVIDAQKVTENMQLLANEMNGNLDRENLPYAAFVSSAFQVEDGCFNELKQTFVENSNFQDACPDFLPLTFVDANGEVTKSMTIDVNVDCVLICHFGCTYFWKAFQQEADNLVSSLATTYTEDGFNLGNSSANSFATDYDNTGEFFVDFLLKINGETVCSNPQLSFLRRKNSVHMSGVLPVAAGKCEITVEVRQYQLVSRGSGKKTLFQKSKAFFLQFKKNEGNLITQVKKR